MDLKNGLLNNTRLVSLLAGSMLAMTLGLTACGEKKKSSSPSSWVTPTPTPSSTPTPTPTPVPDTTAPSAPTISSPATSLYASGETSFTLSGGCETGATVVLSGDSNQTTSCGASTFSFVISKSNDGNYSFNISQTDAANNSSPSIPFQWTRNTVVGTPNITSPAASPYRTNASSLLISGTCSGINTILLSGDATNSTTCSSNTYSFTINKAVDGSYSFSIVQRDGSNNASAAVVQQWIRDTSAPVAPTITSPQGSPYTSGDTTLTLSGACESGTTVSLSGASSQSLSCPSNQTFSFSLSEASDGSYSYNLQQTDAANNASTITSFEWVLDTSIPSAPTITNQTSQVVYSSASSFVISGACTDGNTVDLSGSATDTQICGTTTASTYSFTIPQSVDDSYTFSVTQTNTTTGASSGSTSITWVRDTGLPSTPTRVNPSTSPYTSSGSLLISGNCEINATVYMTGSSSQNVLCSTGSYSLTAIEAVDGTYNYSVFQTDRAGNSSGSFSVQWVKDSTKPSTPTILTPSSNPYISNVGTLTLSGGCTTGNTVTLGGDVTTDSQVCDNNQYSFDIIKAVDGVFSITVKQTNASLIDSALASLQWTLDTAIPNTTLATFPSDPNLATTADFTFTSDDAAAQFECSLNGAAYATCTSPVSFTGLSNAVHSFAVRAKDSSGNIDATPASYSWTQSAGYAVALYHFNTGAETSDSGSYTGGNQNPLTNQGATTGVAGAFSEAVSLSGTNQWLEAAHTSSLALLSNFMTAEARVQLNALPSSGRYTFLAKMGASPNMGWEFGIKKQGNNYRLYFMGSLNGTTATEIQSSNLTAAEQTALTSGFAHVAVTWNKGSVKIFIQGVAKANGTIGTAGTSTLFNNSGASLYVGKTSAGNELNGKIDEVRLSQAVRWTANFTPAATQYTAD